MSAKRFRNVDYNLFEIRNVRAEVLTSDPGTNTAGRYHYRSDLGVLKFGTGSTYITLGRIDQMLTANPPTAALAVNAQEITGVADPTAAQSAATRNYVLTRKITDLTAPTTSVSFNSQKITSLADGTAASDAATVGQITAAAGGIAGKDSVRLATAAALPASTYANGTAGVGATLTENANGALTVDGVAAAVGDRILVKDQASGFQNGIYTVTATGSAGAVFVLTRAVDTDEATDVRGAYTFVEEGSTNQNTGWMMTTDAPYTMGTTALAWSKFTATSSTAAQFNVTGPTPDAATLTVTHNLGSRDVICQVYDASSFDDLTEAYNVVRTDANTITITTDSGNIGLNKLRVVVIKIS